MKTMLSGLGLLALFLIVSGCGGGAGTPQSSQPSAAINFPPPLSEMDTPQVTVSGTAGGDAPIVSVHVNGVPATSSDGYATWQAVVPLTPGVNELRAEVVNLSGGASSEAVATVVRQGGHEVFAATLNHQPARFVFDAAQRKLLTLAYPANSTELLSIDADTGHRELLGGGQPTSIITGSNGLGVALDPVRNRIMTVAYDSLYYPIVRIDPANGAVETMVPSAVDSRALCYDPMRDRLLCFDALTLSILAIDLDTFAISEVSGPNVGNGPPVAGGLSQLPRLVVDTTNDRLFLFNLSTSGPTPGLLEIDPLTGNRSEVTSSFVQGMYLGAGWDATTGELLLLRGIGAPWVVDLVAIDPQSGNGRVITPAIPYEGVWPGRSLVLDPLWHRAYVRGPNAMRSIDLDDGTVSSLSSWAELGAVSASDSALDAQAGIVYVTVPNGPWSTLIKGHDAETGEERFVWDSASASSTSLPTRLAWDAANDRLILRSGVEIQTLDPSSGAFQVLSSAAQGVGSGPGFLNTSPGAGMAASPDGSRIWVGDLMGLYEVDSVTGDRTVVGSLSIAPFGKLAWDAMQERLIIANASEVHGFDPGTATIQLLSGPGAGVGPVLNSLGSLAVNDQGQILVGDAGGNTLLTIDGTTGDRVLLREGFGYANIAGVGTDGSPVLTGYLNQNSVPSGLAKLLWATGEVARITTPLP